MNSERRVSPNHPLEFMQLQNPLTMRFKLQWGDI